MSFSIAIKQFGENLRLFGDALKEPEKHNLYAGLQNLANGLEDLENKVNQLEYDVNRIKQTLDRK